MHPIIRSALFTVVCLFGGMLVGILIGVILHGGLSGHLHEAGAIAVAALSALIGVFAGGALWGRTIAHIFTIEDTRRMAWAAGLGFGPPFILTALSLTVLEVLIVAQGRGPELPIHVVFTILFVPAAFLVAAMGGLALGVAQRDWRLARRLATFGGLSSAVTFLVVNVTMDAMGWRVGAPGAEERFTMVTVLFVGSLGAALVGGGAVGAVFHRYSPT